MGQEDQSPRAAAARETSPLSWAVRVIAYLTGIAILAFGVSLSRRANLGISQLVAWPAVMADIDPDPARNMGWWVSATFIIFVVVEVVVLRRDFKPIQLLQIPVSLAYGSFVNLWNVVTESIPVPNYLASVLLVIASVSIMAVGISVYLTADIVPLSSEGAVLAVAQVTGRPFPRLKQAFDVILIVLAVVTGLVGLGEVRYVREGTVFAALCLGPLIGIANRFVRPFVYRLCYGRPEKDAA